jgi:hypothetical protein
MTVIKSGVVDHILSFAKFKQDQLMKKTDGHKRARFAYFLAILLKSCADFPWIGAELLD